MRSSCAWVLLVTSTVLSACGEDGISSAPDTISSSGGAASSAGGNEGVPGAGGGATAGAGGVVGSAGGAPVAPGQLFCGSKQCRSGGFCATDGGCPAFLGTCFSSAQFSTCGGYCASQGLTCAKTSCSDDGSHVEGGYSWVSYAATAGAECASSAYPQNMSPDQCSSPIWLNPSKPRDDLVRCCCRD